MCTMHRWFNIDAAERDLKYKPIVPFAKGWAITIAWFKTNWLPEYKKRGGGSQYDSIAQSTQRKIDIQKKKAK